MQEKPFLLFVDDTLNLRDRKTELFSQRFVANTINEPSFQELSVSLAVNVLINQCDNLAVCVVHYFRFLVPREFTLFLVRFLVRLITVTFCAIVIRPVPVTNQVKTVPILLVSRNGFGAFIIVLHPRIEPR